MLYLKGSHINHNERLQTMIYGNMGCLGNVEPAKSESCISDVQHRLANGLDHEQRTNNNKQESQKSLQRLEIADEIMRSNSDYPPVRTQELFGANEHERHQKLVDGSQNASKGGEKQSEILCPKDSFPYQESMSSESEQAYRSTSTSITGFGFHVLSDKDFGSDITKASNGDLMTFSDPNGSSQRKGTVDDEDIEKALQSLKQINRMPDMESAIATFPSCSDQLSMYKPAKSESCKSDVDHRLANGLDNGRTTTKQKSQKSLQRLATADDILRSNSDFPPVRTQELFCANKKERHQKLVYGSQNTSMDGEKQSEILSPKDSFPFQESMPSESEQAYRSGSTSITGFGFHVLSDKDFGSDITKASNGDLMTFSDPNGSTRADVITSCQRKGTVDGEDIEKALQCLKQIDRTPDMESAIATFQSCCDQLSMHKKANSCLIKKHSVLAKRIKELESSQDKLQLSFRRLEEENAFLLNCIRCLKQEKQARSEHAQSGLFGAQNGWVHVQAKATNREPTVLFEQWNCDLIQSQLHALYYIPVYDDQFAREETLGSHEKREDEGFCSTASLERSKLEDASLFSIQDTSGTRVKQDTGGSRLNQVELVTKLNKETAIIK